MESLLNQPYALDMDGNLLLDSSEFEVVGVEVVYDGCITNSGKSVIIYGYIDYSAAGQSQTFKGSTTYYL